jgi:hypothetical protein
MKKISVRSDILSKTSSSKDIIEETPVKDDSENDTISSDKMIRDIQRLAVRLRSSAPCKILYFFYRN